jgi:hypothetical protein
MIYVIHSAEWLHARGAALGYTLGMCTFSTLVIISTSHLILQVNWNITVGAIVL